MGCGRLRWLGWCHGRRGSSAGCAAAGWPAVWSGIRHRRGCRLVSVRRSARASTTTSRSQRSRPVGAGHLDGVTGGQRQRRPGQVSGWRAHRRASDQARRPKVAKLAGCERLRVQVEGWLGEELWSPAQISTQLRIEFPDDPMMRVSPETIYQSLYVQARGALRKELTACLRTGRAVRRNRSRLELRGKIADMVNDLRAPRRDRRPGCARPLGRRLDPREEQPFRRRHLGGTFHPLRAAAAPRR